MLKSSTLTAIAVIHCLGALIEMTSNIERFKLYSKKQGFAPDVYNDLLEEFEKHNQILLLRGTDYHNAEHLVRWGFLQQIRKPIISEDGYLRGFEVGFCHPCCNLEHVDDTSDKPF